MKTLVWLLLLCFCASSPAENWNDRRKQPPPHKISGTVLEQRSEGYVLHGTGVDNYDFVLIGVPASAKIYLRERFSCTAVLVLGQYVELVKGERPVFVYKYVGP
jgi:hypothetical protein